jgi:hypothetical protein
MDDSWEFGVFYEEKIKENDLTLFVALKSGNRSFGWVFAKLITNFLRAFHKLLMNFQQSFFILLTNHKQISYALMWFKRLLMNLLQTSYEVRMNFLHTFCKLLTNVLWYSYKSFINFLVSNYFLPTSNVRRTYFLQKL